MFRLSSLYWLEKSVDTVDKSMLLQKMFFSELSVIREHIRVCSFRRIQKRFLILDLPDFAVERNVKSEIGFVTFPKLIAVCTTASQEMTCFLLFDKLCDYTVQILWSAVRMATMEHKQVKKEAR